MNQLYCRAFGKSLSLAGSVMLAMALLSPLYFLVGAMLTLMRVSWPVATFAIVLIAAGTVYAARQFVLPWIAPGFGPRVRAKYRHDLMFPESIEDSQQVIRTVLIALAGCQFVCLLASALILRLILSKGVEIPYESLLVFLKNAASVCLLICGVVILANGRKLFLRICGHDFQQRLRGRGHGILLQEFIAEWDNPGRRIFPLCRTSRRIAYTYRSILLTAAATFSVAGCCAVAISDQYWIGEILVVICIASTMALWPTPPRLVGWTHSLVETVAGDEHDNVE